MGTNHKNYSATLFILTLLTAVGYGLMLPWGRCGAAAWPVWTAPWSGQEAAENVFHLLFDNRFVCIGLFLFNCTLLVHLYFSHLKAKTFIHMPCPLLLFGFTMLPHFCVSAPFMAALTLLMLAVDKWFGALHRGGGQPSTAYAIGWLLGLAGLFYIPTACCIVIFWGGMLRTGSGIRSLASSLVGLLTPFLMLLTALYVFMDVPWEFAATMAEPLWIVPDVAWNTPVWTSIAQGTILFLLAFGAMVSFVSQHQKESSSVKESWLFLTCMLLFTVAAVFLIPSRPAGIFLCCTPFLALLAGHFLYYAFCERNANLILVLLFLLSLLSQEEYYLAAQGRQTFFDAVRHLFQTTPLDFLSCL